jgi:hypothetical protein
MILFFMCIFVVYNKFCVIPYALVDILCNNDDFQARNLYGECCFFSLEDLSRP